MTVETSHVSTIECVYQYNRCESLFIQVSYHESEGCAQEVLLHAPVLVHQPYAESPLQFATQRGAHGCTIDGVYRRVCNQKTILFLAPPPPLADMDGAGAGDDDATMLKEGSDMDSEDLSGPTTWLRPSSFRVSKISRQAM